MAESLTFDRKKILARGLLGGLCGLFLFKSGVVTYHLAATEPTKAMLVGALLLAIASLIGLAATMAIRRPVLSRWLMVLAFPILSFLQLRFVSNLYEMHPVAGVLVVVEQFPLVFGLMLLYDDPASRWAKWSQRSPRLLKWLQRGGIALTACIWLEILMRSVGFQPNLLQRPHWFHPVDQLEIRGDYAADQDGIMTWSPRAVRHLNGLLTQAPDRMNRIAVDTCSFFHDAPLYQAYVDLHNGLIDNEFSRYISQIAQKQPTDRTEIEAAWLAQTQHPLNEHGFRSVPFRNYITPQKKVLLLGDSFTWGFSASNVTNAFAEILQARGYAVFNTGITGTDPAQYEAIARKYIPILQPDVVVVNFFMGNDILNFKREVLPYRMMMYPTNAGIINAYPSAEWLPDPETAYRFVLEEYGIPNREAHWFNDLCAQTAASTQAWRALRSLHLLSWDYPNPDYWQRCKPRLAAQPVSNAHLKAIEAECKLANAKFVLAIIPEMPGLSDKRIPQDYPGLFDGLEIHVPQVGLADYFEKDQHFNDQGHLMYADFLQGLLGSPTIVRE